MDPVLYTLRCVGLQLAMVSPPSRLPKAHQVSIAMLFETNRTAPSTDAALTPPEWRLEAVVGGPLVIHTHISAPAPLVAQTHAIGRHDVVVAQTRHSCRCTNSGRSTTIAAYCL